MENQKNRRYCIAYGCLNSNKNVPYLTLFKLPKEPDRCQKWLELVGRPDLMKIENLKHYSYRVCSIHFKEDYIKTIRQLTPDAMPSSIVYDGATKPNIKRIPPPKQSRHREIQTEKPKGFDVSTQIEDKELENTLKRHNNYENYSSESDCKRPRLDIESITIKVERVDEEQEKENSTFEIGCVNAYDVTIKKEECADDFPTESIEEFPLASPKDDSAHSEITTAKVETIVKQEDSAAALEIATTRTFQTVDIRLQHIIDWLGKLKNPSEPKNQAFALSLLYSNPEAYHKLQTVLKLPNKNNLDEYKIMIPPKVDDEYLKSLSNMVKSLPERDKYCSICVSQMQIKRNVCYDARTDTIYGVSCHSALPEVASQAYVIMIQGIHSIWNQLLGYAFLSNKDNKALCNWINEVIDKLLNYGVDIRAVIMNDDPIFDSYAKEHKSVERPFFFSGGRKIYLIYDASHLLISLRNHLLTNDLYLNGKSITWDWVRKIHEDQKHRNAKVLPKLTNAHVEPNIAQKKKLHYANQIFNDSVAAVIELFIAFAKFPEEASTTSEFVKLISDLYDILNVSKSQHAFSMSVSQVDILEYCLNTFGQIKSVDSSSGVDNTNQMRVFKHFQMTIKSIMKLSEDLKLVGFNRIYTRNLSLENLENFFTSLKHKSDSESTAYQFASDFSKSFLLKLLKSPDSKSLYSQEDLQKAEEVVKRLSHSCSGNWISQVKLPGDKDFRMDLPEVNGIIYVTSYLLYKCSEKHHCSEMDSAMESFEDLNKSVYRNFMTLNKKAPFNGKLKVPPKEMIQYVKRLETDFVDNFAKCLNDRPGNTMFEILTEVPSAVFCPCFPLDYVIKLFVRLRIFSTVKLNNERKRDASSQDGGSRSQQDNFTVTSLC